MLCAQFQEAAFKLRFHSDFFRTSEAFGLEILNAEFTGRDTQATARSQIRPAGSRTSQGVP